MRQTKVSRNSEGEENWYKGLKFFFINKCGMRWHSTTLNLLTVMLVSTSEQTVFMNSVHKYQEIHQTSQG